MYRCLVIYAGLTMLYSCSSPKTSKDPSSVPGPVHLTDIYYKWPKPQTDAAVILTVHVDPGAETRYYWSHFFWFDHTGTAPDANRQAYMGLQTNDGRKLAIFSVWNATEASGSGCETFGGEGIGYHCLIEYDWQAGTPYLLTAKQMSSDASGDLWQGSVTDQKTGVETVVGQILSPANSGGIATSVFFDEMYGSVLSCDNLARSVVSFTGISSANGTKPNFNYHSDRPVCSMLPKLAFSGNDVTIDVTRVVAR